jgi:hypothetical protein
VTLSTREKIARELDDRGPESCLAEMLAELRRTNPEILDIAIRCSGSFGERSREIMLELCVFYRLLIAEFMQMDPALRLLSPFPRVTLQTRARIVEQIDEFGTEVFTMSAIGHLERHNAELLEMMHQSATRRHVDVLPMIQGFALLYQALLEQTVADAAGATLQ